MPSSQPLHIVPLETDKATRWNSQPKIRRIAIVLFEGCDLFGVGALVEALVLAGELAATDAVRCTWLTSLMSGQGGAVKGSSGLQMWTEKVDAWQYAGFDAVFVAAGDKEIVVRELAPMSTWLDRVRADATPLTWLGKQRCISRGEAGCVSPSVTHSDHHAATGVLANASCVAPLHDGLVAALRLISLEVGERVARHVAEHFLVAFHTALASVLDEVSASTPADKVRAAERWLQDNCHRPVSIEDLANVTAMSARSLLRHFRQETGMAPSEYLMRSHRARLPFSVRDRSARRQDCTARGHAQRRSPGQSVQA